MLNALLQDVVQLARFNRPCYHAGTRLPAHISKASLLYSWWQYRGLLLAAIDQGKNSHSVFRIESCSGENAYLDAASSAQAMCLCGNNRSSSSTSQLLYESLTDKSPVHPINHSRTKYHTLGRLYGPGEMCPSSLGPNIKIKQEGCRTATHLSVLQLHEGQQSYPDPRCVGCCYRTPGR